MINHNVTRIETIVFTESQIISYDVMFEFCLCARKKKEMLFFKTLFTVLMLRARINVYKIVYNDNVRSYLYFYQICTYL